MELKRSLQENSGSSINLQAEKIIINSNTWLEVKEEEIIESFDEIKESKRKSYIRVSLDIDYDKFGAKEENCLKWALAKFLDISIDDISIKMIEKGSTKVIVELPENQAEKIILSNKERIDDLLATARIIKIEEGYHAAKRVFAFNIFDSCLNYCHSGACPSISDHFAYHLIDLSVDGYIKNRAYFYSLDEIGTDDTNRLFLSREKMSIIFNCFVKPTLSKEVFEKDQRQIEGSYYHSCIKRKAYWSYLSGKYGNQDKDYTQSEYFIKKTKEIYRKVTEEKSTGAIQELKELLVNNSNIASALDMYRYCFLRQCLNEKDEM